MIAETAANSFAARAAAAKDLKGQEALMRISAAASRTLFATLGALSTLQARDVTPCLPK